MSADLPRAVREAVMLDGKLEVYDLGGMYLLSNRGALSALTGAPAGAGKIERYASGFIEESNGAGFATQRFLTPRGREAVGLTLDTFADLVEWWANAFLAGKLTKQQEHIGRNCAMMQSAAARLGWEALARSAFGEALPPKDVPILYQTYLREKVDWARYYPWELPTALHPLIPGCKGTELSRDQWPVWMAGIHQFLYEAVLGSDIVKAAREKREAEGAVTIHQIIADDVLKSLNSYIPICIGLARRCQTLAEWKECVLGAFDVPKSKQLQLLGLESKDERRARIEGGESCRPVTCVPSVRSRGPLRPRVNAPVSAFRRLSLPPAYPRSARASCSALTRGRCASGSMVRCASARSSCSSSLRPLRPQRAYWIDS